MTRILKKVVQHKQEYIFLNQIKEAKNSGYSLLGEVKLSSSGVWQALMVKEVSENPNYNPNKPKGWGLQGGYR